MAYAECRHGVQSVFLVSRALICVFLTKAGRPLMTDSALNLIISQCSGEK